MNLTPDELDQKIKEARERKEQSSGTGKKEGNSEAAKAMRASADLVSALLVGGLLGYWMDKLLGTKPWFMIALFFLGFVAGILNVYRSQPGQEYKIGFREVNKDETKKDKDKE